MIDPLLLEPECTFEPNPPRRTRVARVRRRNYRWLVRILAIFLIVGAPVMGYLWLMGELTATNYAIMRTTTERSALLDRVGRLDEKLARLESPERLGAIAQRLGMREPSSYAVVTITDTAPAAVPAPPPYRVAFLSAVAAWLRRPW